MGRTEKSARRSAKRRCAIYTRKSTDEGLDQAFNSLDAQREACAAFILSQKHEGWSALPALYDDGGYSGGTMERPALKRLMADIEAGQVDVVVVYKVDRLTRALSDFAKLVEVFDRREVSFVSITQQFNTTTSMGRLTLNVLLSFAQFEREVIGERVRDKIAASKKKGMWMGGQPPLGYDVKDRKLVVNEAEAETVRHIFTRYLELKAVRELQEELAAAGVRSKLRVHPDGTVYGGQVLGRGALYEMLQNRIYRGEITHKGSAYPGQHPAIVDQDLWDRVQATLAENRVERTSGARGKQPSLLTGLVFDQNGERLTPTHAVKKGTRYRYYISTGFITGARKPATGGWRIPAGNLEALVVNRLRKLFADPSELLDTVSEHASSGIGTKQLIGRAGRIAEDLANGSPGGTRPLVISLVRRVVIGPDSIEIEVVRHRLISVLQSDGGRSPDANAANANPGDAGDINPEDIVTLTIAARLQRAGREMRMVVQNASDERPPDPALLRALVRAHDFRERLMQDPHLSAHDIARAEGVSAAYIYATLRLAWLAPDIVEAIVNGRQPSRLTATELFRLSGHLPLGWPQQRTLIGFTNGDTIRA
jgi:DNA invertase Pin-like site-specific DNA recombinase